MKGIIIAAGKGTRLYPITIPVCKPLLPVYDKPLIYYSMATLMQAGIKEILIIVPPGEINSFEELFGDGTALGIHVEYKEQKVQRGIADAFILGADFIGKDSVCLVLGDNIFFGPDFRQIVHSIATGFRKGAVVFGYYLDDPSPFGVVEFDTLGKVISIEEKPSNPKSNYIVPGLYFYDNRVTVIASTVKPSARGELEITSVNEEYLKKQELRVEILNSAFSWFDAGTADSLHKAASAIKAEQKNGKMVACIEEISLENHWITKAQLKLFAESMKQTEYGNYLLRIAR